MLREFLIKCDKFLSLRHMVLLHLLHRTGKKKYIFFCCLFARKLITFIKHVRLKESILITTQRLKTLQTLLKTFCSQLRPALNELLLLSEFEITFCL